MTREFIATGPQPLPGQRAAISNNTTTLRDRIERKVREAIVEHEAASTPAPLHNMDAYAALRESMNNALARIAAHTRPAGDSPAQITNARPASGGFLLPPGDDNDAAQITNARAGGAGFKLPK